MFLSELFETFLKEKRFLSNLAPKTIRSYQQAFNAYQRVLSKSAVSKLVTGLDRDRADALPTKDALKDLVIE